MRADDFAAKFLKVTEGGTYLHRECGRAKILLAARSLPLARRSILKGIGVTSLGFFAGTPFLMSSSSEADTLQSAPVPGTCDCHVHVFMPDRFPFASKRSYTPGVASVAELRAFNASHGIDRTVIVQPSVYGNDNACLIAALEELGAQSVRGIAVIDPKTVTDTELDRLHKAGVRGVRINLEVQGEESGTAAASAFRNATARIASRGWAIQVYADLKVIASIKEEISASQTPIILDHFAGARGERGLDQPGLPEVLDLVKSGHAYVKLSAPYRASKQAPAYDDLAPIAKMFIAANPERLIWGSDWPHTGSSANRDPNKLDVVEPFRKVDDQSDLARIIQWAPDEYVRRMMLVDNPARLYGF
jgi:predicted TIM-barrel fold metal-dependent hydrolase